MYHIDTQARRWWLMPDGTYRRPFADCFRECATHFDMVQRPDHSYCCRYDPEEQCRSGRCPIRDSKEKPE